MNDKIYESAKWIAIGIMLGYFGKYALNWIKSKQNDSSQPEKIDHSRNEYSEY